MTAKFVVYTAISNHYDFLRDTPVALEGVEFVCFSDCYPPGNHHGWLVTPFPNSIGDPTRRCRDVKINAHRYFPEHKYSLWVDSNVQILDSVVSLLIELLADGVAFSSFRHPSRTCVYEEAIACKRKNKDDHGLIDLQIEFLRRHGYPEKMGLYETNVIFRAHNNPIVVEAMRIWDDLLTQFSKRDQLGINFAIWKSGVDASFLPGTSRGDNPAFLRGKHRTRGKPSIRAYIEAYSYGNPLFRALRRLKSRRH